jgi:hypothetical protein
MNTNIVAELKINHEEGTLFGRLISVSCMRILASAVLTNRSP